MAELYIEDALHRAVKQQNHNKVLELLMDGYDPNELNKNGDTPLHIASRLGDKETLLLLHEAGACMDVLNTDGKTALMLADELKPGECTIRDLLELGANPDIQDANGNTALHLAAMVGDDYTVQTLLEHGADPLIPNLSNNNALDLALGNACDDAAYRLMEFTERSRHVAIA